MTDDEYARTLAEYEKSVVICKKLWEQLQNDSNKHGKPIRTITNNGSKYISIVLLVGDCQDDSDKDCTVTTHNIDEIEIREIYCYDKHR